VVGIPIIIKVKITEGMELLIKLFLYL